MTRRTGRAVSMSDFIHLHCHTEYSLLDGAIRIPDLFARAADFGMTSAAITDHGNLYGALTFYSTAKKFGIKPIIGCEVYVAPGRRTEKNATSSGKAGHHLILLAQDMTGYRNLVKLVSLGFLEGFHYKPRVDKKLLARHGEGLVALSACLKGEVPQELLGKGMDAGIRAAREYAALFPDRFYLELQANGLKEQERLNERLLELSSETGLPLVATNDCHYLDAADVEAHDVLLCIQTNATVDAERRMRFTTQELYYRPPEEMERAFTHCPEAVANTQRIAEACRLELPLGRRHFPVYALPEGQSLEEEFRRLSREGLARRLAEMPGERDGDVYRKRLEEELDVICDKGFAGYFLIVQDFINWAKRKGIPVGPGRGSAAGSLAAYALNITNLDPLAYTLLFERFLNAERESLPDIDVDFCYNRRDEVIAYVTQKYGADCVAQITTFGTMKAKAAVRDVGRALGMSFAETDRIAKLIPDDLKMTLDKALEQEPRLKEAMRSDERIQKLLDISRRLEGMSRHASTHAAGIVISDGPMMDFLPLYLGKRGEVVTQFDMKRVEQVGLIKFDFLGLKTLTVVNDTLRILKHAGKNPPDMDALPLDDTETFAMLSRAETDGVFQLESSGMRNVLADLKPNCFEDLIALLALYRPGPLESGMVADFVRGKHGEIPVTYMHPALEPILKDTYGVILYQEQVMKIAQVLADYSLGDGDTLRRAMGKKDPAVMARERTKFLDGARRNNISEETAQRIFDLMEKFAGYGFNKSHSAAYALISYQTAYLKAHHPAEFMAATMTSEVNNTDKIIAHVAAGRDMGLTILPPDVNASHEHFTVENGSIRFGLSGIKNVGRAAIQSIVREREADGPFVSLLDFCQRVNLRQVTKRVVEYLIKSGALDAFGCSRAWLMGGLDRVMAMSQRSAREKSKGQLSLMTLMPEAACSLTGLGLAGEEQGDVDWDDQEKLFFEKEALGFYLMGNPLLPFRNDIHRLGFDSLADCREYGPGREVRVAVTVAGMKLHNGAKGQMAFCQLEDLTGVGEATFFSEALGKYRHLLEGERPVVVVGRISSFRSEAAGEEGRRLVKIDGFTVEDLETVVRASVSEPVVVEFRPEDAETGRLESFARVLERHSGATPVKLVLTLEGKRLTLALGQGFGVSPGPALWKSIREWREER